MWRACKAPSRVQWYSKLHTLMFSVCFAVWRACKDPSRVQWYPKTALSRVQCVFVPFFLLPVAYTTPSKRETKNIFPLETLYKNILYSELRKTHTFHCFFATFPSRGNFFFDVLLKILVGEGLFHICQIHHDA